MPQKKDRKVRNEVQNLLISGLVLLRDFFSTDDGRMDHSIRCRHSENVCSMPPNLGFLGLKEVTDAVVTISVPALIASMGYPLLLLGSVSPLGVLVDPYNPHAIQR